LDTLLQKPGGQPAASPSAAAAEGAAGTAVAGRLVGPTAAAAAVDWPAVDEPVSRRFLQGSCMLELSSRGPTGRDHGLKKIFKKLKNTALMSGKKNVQNNSQHKQS
jgi:hypothetical protein